MIEFLWRYTLQALQKSFYVKKSDTDGSKILLYSKSSLIFVSFKQNIK